MSCSSTGLLLEGLNPLLSVTSSQYPAGLLVSKLCRNAHWGVSPLCSIIVIPDPGLSVGV